MGQDQLAGKQHCMGLEILTRILAVAFCLITIPVFLCFVILKIKMITGGSSMVYYKQYLVARRMQSLYGHTIAIGRKATISIDPKRACRVFTNFVIHVQKCTVIIVMRHLTQIFRGHDHD
jgi:hypothetical protein